MSRSVLVLQHAPWETPALIETALGDLPMLRRTIVEERSPELPPMSQLLGLALGATLHLQHGKEIGFAPVTLTEAGARDPVLGAFAGPASPALLHWHSDAVELPRGAELLASTAVTPVQSFRIGSALGTQFHPEADAALLQGWLRTPAMIDSLPPGLAERIRADGEIHLPGLRTAALAGLARFADAVRRR